MIMLYNVLFWAVWLVLCPFVYLYYIWKEISDRRFYFPIAYTKTSLVFLSVKKLFLG